MACPLPAPRPAPPAAATLPLHPSLSQPPHALRTVARCAVAVTLCMHAQQMQQTPRSVYDWSTPACALPAPGNRQRLWPGSGHRCGRGCHSDLCRRLCGAAAVHPGTVSCRHTCSQHCQSAVHHSAGEQACPRGGGGVDLCRHEAGTRVATACTPLTDPAAPLSSLLPQNTNLDGDVVQ